MGSENGPPFTILSGGPAGPGELHWTNSPVWNNTGDTAHLVDPPPPPAPPGAARMRATAPPPCRAATDRGGAHGLAAIPQENRAMRHWPSLKLSVLPVGAPSIAGIEKRLRVIVRTGPTAPRSAENDAYRCNLHAGTEPSICVDGAITGMR